MGARAGCDVESDHMNMCLSNCNDGTLVSTGPNLYAAEAGAGTAMHVDAFPAVNYLCFAQECVTSPDLETQRPNVQTLSSW
jgi:hypothetical protein